MEYEDEEESYKPSSPDDFYSGKEEERMFGESLVPLVNGLINKTLLDESPPGGKRLTALDEMIIFTYLLSAEDDELRDAIKTSVLGAYNDILSGRCVILVETIPVEDEELLDEEEMKAIKDLALGLYRGYYSTDVIDSNGLNHLQQIIYSYYFFDRDKWQKIETTVYQKYLNLRGGSHISG